VTTGLATLDRPLAPPARGTTPCRLPATRDPRRVSGRAALAAGAPVPATAPAPAIAPARPGPRPAPTAGRPARPTRRGPGRRALLAWVAGGGAAVAAVLVLAAQLRDADLAATLAAVRPEQLALAALWFALSLVAAAYNVSGFSVLRLRLRETLLAQLAVGGLRLVAPSALSTPAVMMRYLVRSGATVPDAATTVGASQSAQLLATAAVVGALGVHSGRGWSALPGGRGLAVAAVAGTLLLAGAAAARRSERVRGWARTVWRSQVALAGHARRHPGRVAAGLLASAGLTLTHVLAFAACVAAAGGRVPLLTLAAVYLGAAAAGSLVPTPGGIGAVEAALVAGLTAAGLGLPASTAAALLSRLVAVWLPAVPGVLALAVLRRRGLL
jgi:glycosyltransferase 2 family protein